jgi:hypothetical protein
MQKYATGSQRSSEEVKLMAEVSFMQFKKDIEMLN